MGNKLNLHDYEKWQKENEPEAFSLLDYIHGVALFNHLKIDLAFSFMELFWPSFIEVDGHLLLENFYDKDRYDENVSTKMASSEVELWMNLILLDDLFEEMEYDLTVKLCQNIAIMWRCKLKQEFPKKSIVVKEFVEEGDDIGLTFFTQSPNESASTLTRD